MRTVLGLLVSLATIGLASPALACEMEGCNCGSVQKSSCNQSETQAAEGESSCANQKAENDDRGEADETTTATAEATIDIEGMSCGGCAKTVASALRDLDGVAGADVSFEQGRATVRYDDEQVDPEALVDTVESAHAGKFSAKLVSNSEVES